MEKKYFDNIKSPFVVVDASGVIMPADSEAEARELAAGYPGATAYQVEEKPGKGADFWDRVDALKADYEPTTESRELALYAINSGWLYRGTVNRVIDLLARRINRGTYDASKAVKAFDGAVKEAAVRYIQEFSTPDYTGFKPVGVRRACAAEMLEHYAEEIAERADANKLQKMSVYQIREKMNRAGYAPHFWDHDTLAFFGESIGAMRVLQEPGTMEGRKCYVISSFQRKAPGGGCTAYHYIDAETFEHVGTLHSW